MSRAHGNRPEVPSTGAAVRLVPALRGGVQVVTGIAQILAALATAPLSRRWFNRWGTTPADRAAHMPGDDLLPVPKLGYTRAITIAAPPAAVWPWLVQIGQGRGGLYSFDALENLVGCDIHSADVVLDAHQQLRLDDLVRLGPEGYPCFAVASVDPPRTLVLLTADPATGRPVPAPVTADGSGGATWQWQLVPAGTEATRLVVRQRLTYPRWQAVLWHVLEPIAFVMERRMLIGIRQRAERQAGRRLHPATHMTPGANPTEEVPI